jgi:hypothetical protein
MPESEVTLHQSIDDQEGDEFPELKAGGPMLFTIAELSLRSRKDGNGQFLNVEFDVIDVNDDENSQNVGRKHWEILSLSEASGWKLKAFFGKLVADGERIGGGEDDPINEACCAKRSGRMLVASLRIEKYNGNENLRLFKMKRADEWEDGLNFHVVDGELTEYDDVKAPVVPSNGAGASTMDGALEV